MAARKGIQRKITLSRHFDDLVKEIADYYGVAESEIASRCFEQGISIILQQYVEHRSQVESRPLEVLRSLLARLTTGDAVPDAELEKVAQMSGVSIAALQTIRDKLTTP